MIAYEIKSNLEKEKLEERQYQKIPVWNETIEWKNNLEPLYRDKLSVNGKIWKHRLFYEVVWDEKNWKGLYSFYLTKVLQILKHFILQLEIAKE